MSKKTIARMKRMLPRLIRRDGQSGADRLLLLPAEQVLLLCLPLPPMSAVQRGMAIAYAAEDHLASPLDQVRVQVIGPAPSAGHWLVAVFSPTILEGLATPEQMLVPEVLVMPIPTEGAWTVRVAGARVVIRCSDGTGFAVPLNQFGDLHTHAAMPDLYLVGPDPLPGFATIPLPMADPAQATTLPGHDLNPARATMGWRNHGRAGLLLAAAAITAHLALSGLDLLVLAQQSALSQARLHAGIEAKGGTPADKPGSNPEDLAIQMIAAAEPVMPGGPLPLLAQAFQGLAPLAGGVQLHDLTYSADPPRLTLGFEAAELSLLQELEGALAQGGLQVVAGAASRADGLARQQFEILGGQP